jgi:hypothetical protein
LLRNLARTFDRFPIIEAVAPDHDASRISNASEHRHEFSDGQWSARRFALGVVPELCHRKRPRVGAYSMRQMLGSSRSINRSRESQKTPKNFRRCEECLENGAPEERTCLLTETRVFVE